MTHKNLLKILFVEDLPSDAELAVLELRKEGLRFEHMRVDTRDEFIKALNMFIPDIIISDYMMPSYNGMQALKDAMEFDPSVPFILFTGSINEETAVECLKAGATDYVIKEHLTRLPFAVKEALEHNLIEKEKKAAELLLKESEEKLQSIFSAAPVGIGLVVNRIFMEINDTFCKMTGYTRKALIGKSSELIYATKEEFESDGIEKYRQISEKGTGSVETRLKCKNGKILNILLSSAPLDKNNLTKGVTFTVMDITKRKLAEGALQESQHLFQTLALVSPVGIFRTDPDGKTTYVNPKWSELSGLTLEEAEGFNWLNAVHPDDKEKLKESWLSDFKSRKTSSAEYRFLRPDGSTVWVMGNAEPEWINNEIVGYIGTITDITGRKQAEEVLRSSEERLKILFDYAPDAYYLNDLKGNFIDGNIAAEKLLGHDKNELIGKNFLKLNLLSLKQLPRAAKLLVKNSLGYATGPDEFVLNRKDCSKVIAEIITHPVKIKDKTLVLGIARDITKRKHAEEVLRESESSLRDAQEIAKMGSWEWDMVTQKTSWSDNYFAILGYKFMEVEPNFELFRSRIHPDDVHLLDKTHARIMSDKSPSGMELRLILPDGTVKWIQNNISPVIEDDKLVKLKGVIIDITERKRAEDMLRESEMRYKALFSNAAEGILVAKIETMQFLYANPVLCKMFGYTEEELMLMGVQDIHPKESLDYVRAEFEAQMRGEKTLVSDLPCLRKDGTLFYADIRSTLIVIDGFKCNVGFFIDITERKLAEKELINARDKAEENDRLKTAFLHNISHEIRTPMNAIVGFSALLGEPDIDQQTQQSYIETIMQSSNHLLSIISDIIDISNIEANIVKIVRNEINVNFTLNSVFNQFLLKAEEKKIKLVCETGLTDSEASVITDNTRLTQVLTNLISNALKFTDKGFVKAEYKVKENFLEFCVSDTGIGIPQEFYYKIFDRFYQVQNIISRIYEGTGLGLAISKAYVELMGGKIWLSSEPGKGTSFYFTIPYERQTIAPLPVIENPVDKGFVFTGKKTILVAEDIDSNFKLLTYFLSGSNIEILRAMNGKEAFEKCLSNRQIDLVLMDIKMPEMDGYTAVKLIRDANITIPIVAQTAYSDDREMAIARGCNGFISKPFDKKNLIKVLSEFI